MPIQHRAERAAESRNSRGSGRHERNVAMSATETIAVNERVLAADPLVKLQPANEAANTPEVPGGIGEEDIITLVLPYVTTAREGVARLAELLETYGTYESNGIIIFRRKRNLVCRNDRRAPLDRPPRAGRLLCDHPQPARHRRFRLRRRLQRPA